MKWKNRKAELEDEIIRLRGLSPFVLLRVSTDASADYIRKAYRNLVKAYHPDKSDPFMRRHNEEVLKIINAAYSELISRLEKKI